jgi:hypothetical protein
VITATSEITVILEKCSRAQSLYEEGNVEEIRKISNQLELHESYIVEMRRDVQSKLVDLIRNKKKEIE